ncbi:MAG: DoxX family protein [Microscillaceae bacterium]|nr:DoxX family protein [Microscillaceae bacterium]
MNKNQVIISWIFQLVAAIIMLQTLRFKFGAHPDSVMLFTTLGMEPWGRIGTGVIELLASILLFIPRTVWFGALMAVGLMAGAIFFHLTILGVNFNNDGGSLFGLALAVMVSALVILFLRRKQIPYLATFFS